MSDDYSANDEYLNQLNDLKEQNNEESNENENMLKEVKNNFSFLEKGKKKTAAKPKGKKPAAKGKGKLKGKGKGKPQKPKSGTQVKIIPNKLLLKNTKGIESYAKCQKRTGVLNLIRGQSKLPFVLNLLPVYIHLGLPTFNIYKTRSSKTLLTTLKLVDIVRVNQRRFLTKFNCFDLILGDNVNLRLKGDDQITLCAKNQIEMTNWIKTFLEFKECQVDVKKLNNADQVMLDYKKVHELLKVPPKAVIPPQKKVNTLYYDATDNTYRKPPQAIYKEIRVRKIVKNIMDSMTKGNMRNDQVKRQLKDKLKKARKFTQDVGKKQGVIESLVARRVNLERKKQLVKVGKKQKKKEVALLKAVKQRMIQLKKKEIEDLSKRVKKEINSEKKKASDEAKNMMRVLINAKKLTPYDDCTDNRLFNFSDKNYVSTLCKRYYGEFVSLYFLYFFKFIS